MTITLGWWMIPLLITIGLIIVDSRENDPWGLHTMFITIPVTLISWLIWALLKAFDIIGF